ncbi:MAG: TonB family protein [Bacteroidota bacterium]
MFAPEFEAMERRHMRISIISTTVLMVILALLCFLFVAYRQRVPPPGKKYEVLGAIDFGDLKNGSKKVNSFERSIPDPAPTPPPPAEAQPAQPEPEPTPTPPKTVTTPKPTPVSQPTPPKTTTPKPTPAPPKETTPKPKPTPKPAEPTPKPAPTTSPPSKQPSTTPAFKPSGANQGNASSGTGNTGTPAAPKLDPNGMFSFGTGAGGGLNGRQIIRQVQPAYDAQEEGELEFDFWIDRAGNVVYVKPRPTNKPALRNAAVAALKQWKFSALPNGPERQGPIRIKVKFRLKG